MKILKIKKSGKLFIDELDGENAKSKKVGSIKEYLACEVEFERGLTFGTLFKLIAKEADFFDVVFSEELNGRSLKEYAKKINEKPKDFKDDFTLEYLEISKIFELFAFEKGSTIDLFPVFIGIGKTKEGLEIFIPLSFFFINELKNVEIVANKLVEVYREIRLDTMEDGEEVDDDEVEGEEMEEGGVAPLFEAVTRLTLYEAIQCVLYEIVFYKDDEDKIKVRKNQNNEQSNKNKIDILEMMLRKHIESEEYEKAAGIKRELEKLKAASNLGKN